MQGEPSAGDVPGEALRMMFFEILWNGFAVVLVVGMLFLVCIGCAWLCQKLFDDPGPDL